MAGSRGVGVSWDGVRWAGVGGSVVMVMGLGLGGLVVDEVMVMGLEGWRG